MTKQEMLTKLAIECKTWSDANFCICGLGWFFAITPAPHENITITEQEWLAERERLLNKPSWKDAPVWATHLMATGSYWHWLRNGENKPFNNGVAYGISDESRISSKIVHIPAGYDWRDSLEVRPTCGGVM